VPDRQREHQPARQPEAQQPAVPPPEVHQAGIADQHRDPKRGHARARVPGLGVLVEGVHVVAVAGDVVGRRRDADRDQRDPDEGRVLLTCPEGQVVSEHRQHPHQHPEQRLGGDHPPAQRAEQVDDRAPQELEAAGQVQRRRVADLRRRKPRGGEELRRDLVQDRPR
jgi:hypothetical protein